MNEGNERLHCYEIHENGSFFGKWTACTTLLIFYKAWLTNHQAGWSGDKV